MSAESFGMALWVGSLQITPVDFSGIQRAFAAALESGNYAVALPLVYLVGLGTAFTPCVYPMIAITVSVFGAKKAESKRESAMLSAAFVLGIATLFTPLGVIAGMTGGLFASWLNSPWVIGSFAVLFVALAFSMFGFFELALPSSVMNRLQDVGGIGKKGAFAMGLVSALIAAPCTGPGFIALLTWIGTTKNIGFGALSTFIYALGLGTLFFVVGTFSVSLPKSGRWLDSVKLLFGTILLILALYYLKDLIPSLVDPIRHTDAFLFGAIALLLVSMGLMFGPAISKKLSLPEKLAAPIKSFSVAAGVLGGFLLVGWMITPAEGGLRFRNDWQAAIAEAQQQGRPYLVDFGASWCQECGELERGTFADTRVAREAGRFVAIRVDLSPTQDHPDKRALLRSYNQRGLPLVVMHDGQGREVHRVVTFTPPERFVELMRAVR